MKKYFISLITFSLIIHSSLASEFVVGPAGGAVFGPQPSMGSALNGIVLDVKLEHNEEESKILDYYAFKMDERDGKLTCKYEPEKMKASVLATSINRLAQISYTMPFLQDPTRAKATTDPALSESVDMFTATETLSTAQLSANEVKMNANSSALIARCEKYQSNSDATSQVQLFTQGCMIYLMIKTLTDLNADRDTITQKTIELNTVMNQAVAENSVREEKVQQAKQKVTEVNKELKTSIDKVKKAVADLKKAKTQVEDAKKSVDSANSTPCTKGEDDKEDCSARDNAVALANASMKKAEEAVVAAEKDVKKASDELLTLLKTKFNYEATTILALLSGTIKGDANGTDVHFKVNDKDFTLVDSDAAIASMVGGKSYHEHWGRYKEENPNGSQEEFMALISEGQVNNYFSTVASHLDNSRDDSKKYYDLFGGEITRESRNLMNTGILHTTNQSEITSTILDKFSTMGSSGAENILTIASAVGDYQASSSQQNVAQLQAMKTPQSRINEVAKKIEQLNLMSKNIGELIANNICILDTLLNQYKSTYNVLYSPTIKQKPDPYLLYIYEFSSAAYSKKFKEGYKSEVNLKKILGNFECLSLGKGDKCFVK